MRKEHEYEQGPKGLGELRILEDGKLQLTNAAGIVYVIPPEQSYAPLPEGAEPGKKYPNVFFRMNNDGDTLYELKPFGEPAGPDWFVVRYKHATRREGEEPTHFLKEGRKVVWIDPQGKQQSFYDKGGEMFNVILEIIAGEMRGCEIKAQLGYFFREDPTDGSVMFRGQDGIGKFTDAFLSLAGFDWDARFPWTPNVVPVVDQMLQDAAHESIFRVRLKKGWIKEVQGVDEDYKEYLLAKEQDEENKLADARVENGKEFEVEG